MTTRQTLRVATVLLLGGAMALAGCSTIHQARGGPGDKVDPWENWNRKVFKFNEDLDTAILKPVATAYSNVIPQPVRSGVGNFFGNFADAWSSVNNFLQGKFALGFQDMMRFGTNTVFGLFGVMDVAAEMGLDHQYEDFGQTLGTWGVGAGAYIVWPVLGPSTVRESFALPLDRGATPALIFQDGASKYSITALQVVNARANLLGATRVLDDIALDKYTFVRDAYLQRRRSLVFDGDAPETDAGGASAPLGSASAPAK